MLRYWCKVRLGCEGACWSQISHSARGEPQEDPMIPDQQQREADGVVGTRDGLRAGDHDQPYHFGRRPQGSVPYPFSTRQYIRLLVLRGRVQDGLIGSDDVGLAA